MTKRNFIKKFIAGMASLFFLSSVRKTKPTKKELPTESCAHGINRAFGHSLPHLEFKEDHEPLDFIS